MQKKHDNQIAEETYPVALTIAGSDSGGGAGIQADLRTFSSFGVYGTSAITSVTAQNPCEIHNITPLTVEAVTLQIKAVFAKFAVKAVKTGMLQNASIIRGIANLLKNKDIPIIVDPVMIATSGSELLERDAIDSMKNIFLPLSDWMTPNIAEAEKLLDIKIKNFNDMKNAAAECAERWNTVCILKDGDFKANKKRAVDIVASRGKLYTLSTDRVRSTAETEADTSHGTGCTFSSAIAATLALNMSWKDTLVAAKAFVFGSLSEPVMVGNSICAMYPPAGTYRDKVIFEKL